MPVEIRPSEFSMVFFDAAEIRAIVEQLVAEVGLPGDLTVTIEVEERKRQMAATAAENN